MEMKMEPKSKMRKGELIQTYNFLYFFKNMGNTGLVVAIKNKKGKSCSSLNLPIFQHLQIENKAASDFLTA